MRVGTLLPLVLSWLLVAGDVVDPQLPAELAAEQKLEATNAAFDALDRGMKQLVLAPPTTSAAASPSDGAIAALLRNAAAEKYAMAAAARNAYVPAAAAAAAALAAPSGSRATAKKAAKKPINWGGTLPKSFILTRLTPPPTPAPTPALCPPGKHVDVSMLGCVACRPGRYQHLRGAHVCFRCKPGRQQPRPGATSCAAVWDPQGEGRERSSSSSSSTSSSSSSSSTPQPPEPPNEAASAYHRTAAMARDNASLARTDAAFDALAAGLKASGLFKGVGGLSVAASPAADALKE